MGYRVSAGSDSFANSVRTDLGPTKPPRFFEDFPMWAADLRNHELRTCYRRSSAGMEPKEATP